MMYYSVMTQAYSEKEIPSMPVSLVYVAKGKSENLEKSWWSRPRTKDKHDPYLLLSALGIEHQPYWWVVSLLTSIQCIQLT